MQKSSREKKFILKIASIVIEIIVLLTAVTVFAYSVLGWFVNNNTVSGNGLSVQLEVSNNLQIRASSTGEDIGVTSIDKDTTSITFPDMTEKEIYPGVSGQITFYVHDGSEGTQNAYSFSYRIKPQNDEWCEDGNHPQGFFARITDGEKALVLQYMSAHIMFFKSFNQGVYSDWINPESPADVDVASAATPCEVTVYWIWVPNYSDIFVSPSPVLADGTREEIANYYLQAGNVNKLFNGENSQDGFDAADTVIGVSVKYMCFVIEVIG